MAKRGASGLNMLLGIDKPVGMTSHDVVSQLRRALGERRIGHSGTLDPLASGVMVVGVGQATRLMAYATAQDKRYLARFQFGFETDTDDAQGSLRCEAPVPADALDEAWAAAQTARLLAMTEQLPPAYSAIKVDGVRAYDAARKGAELDLAARPIAVTAAQLCAVGADEQGRAWWDVAVAVSKGTYVRALARDLGRQLGSACHVSALRRLGSGRVSLPDCVPLADLASAGAAAARPLDPVRVLDCPALALTAEEVRAVRDGKRLSVARTGDGSARAVQEGARLALVRDGLLFAVALRQGSAIAPAAVFADGVAGVSATPATPGSLMSQEAPGMEGSIR